MTIGRSFHLIKSVCSSVRWERQTPRSLRAFLVLNPICDGVTLKATPRSFCLVSLINKSDPRLGVESLSESQRPEGNSESGQRDGWTDWVGGVRKLSHFIILPHIPWGIISLKLTPMRKINTNSILFFQKRKLRHKETIQLFQKGAEFGVRGPGF